MRTEKRIYVKPYTAVLNVQTEGVIAASGGEIEIPETEWNSTVCSNSFFNKSANTCNDDFENGMLDAVANCQIGEGSYNSCLKSNIYYKGNLVVPAGKATITKKRKGNSYVIIVSEGWDNIQ